MTMARIGRNHSALIGYSRGGDEYIFNTNALPRLSHFSQP